MRYTRAKGIARSCEARALSANTVRWTTIRGLALFCCPSERSRARAVEKHRKESREWAASVTAGNNLRRLP